MILLFNKQTAQDHIINDNKYVFAIFGHVGAVPSMAAGNYS